MVILASLDLHAQGTVFFQNPSSWLVFNMMTGNPVTSAEGIRVALYWAPLSESDHRHQGNS